MLVKARTYYVPRGHYSKKTKIYMVGSKKKNRYYYGDRDYYRNDYLKSEHWKDLRAKKLQLNPVCEKCGSNKRVEPHHLIYKNLHDICVEDLMTLCRICHEELHRNENAEHIRKSKQRAIRSGINHKKKLKRYSYSPPTRMPKELKGLIRKYKNLCTRS